MTSIEFKLNHKTWLNSIEKWYFHESYFSHRYMLCALHPCQMQPTNGSYSLLQSADLLFPWISCFSKHSSSHSLPLYSPFLLICQTLVGIHWHYAALSVRLPTSNYSFGFQRIPVSVGCPLHPSTLLTSPLTLPLVFPYIAFSFPLALLEISRASLSDTQLQHSGGEDSEQTESFSGDTSNLAEWWLSKTELPLTHFPPRTTPIPTTSATVCE